MLLDLHEVFRSDPARYRGIPMYLNAPMAAKANGIYAEGMCRKELSRKNSLKPVWRAKQLASVLGLPDTAEGKGSWKRGSPACCVGSSARRASASTTSPSLK